ncbi:GTPase [Azospirillum sp. B4]|uniref:GTPase n=1 Tax=Azospirillum sp. B4 TaxID=95605 RepID=UPI000348A27B|nr:GTPase [Azospirillum sp. B4]
MTIAFSRYFEELVAVMGEAEKLVTQADTPDSALLRSLMSDARERVATNAPLRIAVIGEFSAGKSSLIRALTGTEIKIDADVCTAETCEYPWQGIMLVDTPGIQAHEDDTDHDRIAREATVGADLVLFVITNELFNPRLARHLRFILDKGGLDLAKKTALILNKVDRESNPEETLRSEIQKVLGPHQDVPIYFCSASKYLQTGMTSAEIKERFVRQSRIPELTEGINRFVDDAGTLGRLTAPLQIVVSVLDSLQASLAPSDMDRKRLEIVRRQRAVLQRLQSRLLDVRKTWKQHAYSKVLNLADAAVKQIDELTTGENLEELFQLGMKAATGELDSLHDTVAADVSAALNDARAKLDEIGDSPLAKEVGASGERGATVGVKFDGERPGGNELAAKLGKTAAKPLQEGLELAAKNAKGIRDVVYKIGKAMGKKFRPHEAVKAGEKLAKIAGKVGKTIPYLIVALDFYLEYREEKEKDEKAKYLAEMRISLRNTFADQAKLEADTLEAGIIAISQGPVAEALATLDAEQAAVAVKGSQMEETARKIARVMERCTHLRNTIMRGIYVEPPEGEPSQL